MKMTETENVYPIPIEGNHRCDLYAKAILDKKADSCEGCKVVACPARGIYAGHSPLACHSGINSFSHNECTPVRCSRSRSPRGFTLPPSLNAPATPFVNYIYIPGAF